MKSTGRRRNPESVLYQYGDFAYTYRMFESDFEVDGSFREIWLHGKVDAWPNVFFGALSTLDLNWQVGDGQWSTEEEISALLGSSDPIRIYLLQAIELYAYAWESDLNEMEMYADPTEVFPANCAQVFNFMSNIGRALNVDVYLGDEGREQGSTSESDYAFLGYDPQTNSFRRLHPPVEPSASVRIF